MSDAVSNTALNHQPHDLEQIRRFLKALDGNAEKFTFQFFWDDKERRDRKEPPPRGMNGLTHDLTVEESCAFVTNWNSIECPMGCFVTINATALTGSRAEKDVCRVRAVFIDIDEDFPRVEEALKRFPLAPSAWIESSPGKAHFYWFVQGDFPLDRFTPVQEALIKHFNTDKSVKDLSRVLRLPGTVHCKYVVEGEAPSAVRIADLVGTRRYTYEQIVDALAQSGSVVGAARATQTLSQASALQRASNVIEGAFPARPVIVGDNELSAGIRNFDRDKARSAGWFLVDHGKFYGRDGWMSDWVFPMAAEAILHPDLEPQIKAVFDGICRHSEHYAAARGKNTSGWAIDSDVQWDDAIRRGRRDRTLASTYREALALGWQWQPAAAQIVQALGSVAGASGAGAAVALVGQVIPPPVGASSPPTRPKLRFQPPIVPDIYDWRVGKQMFEERWVYLKHRGAPEYYCRTDDGCLVAVHRDSIAEELSNVYVHVDARDGAKTMNLFTFMEKDTRGRGGVLHAVFKPDGSAAPHEFNMWHGFDVTPQAGTEKVRPLLRHIRQVICKRDRAKYKYVMRWMAWTVQNPDKPAGAAIVLQSKMEGTGKSTLSNVLLRIFGQQHGRMETTPYGFLAKFNPHLEYASFVALEEVSFAGDKKLAEQIKSRLTGEYINIEAKHRASRAAPNRLHAMITTNDDQAVDAGEGARRWFIADVSAEKAQDRAWFKAIHDGLEAGGYGQFLNLLLNMKLGAFHPAKDLVRTRELARAQASSAGSVFDWLIASAVQGALVGSAMRSGLKLDADYALDAVYEQYSVWVSAVLRADPDKPMAFKYKLNKVLGPAKQAMSNGKRERKSYFPDADKLRSATLKAFGVPDGDDV
jgi:hypothetical protein